MANIYHTLGNERRSFWTIAGGIAALLAIPIGIIQIAVSAESEESSKDPNDIASNQYVTPIPSMSTHTPSPDQSSPSPSPFTTSTPPVTPSPSRTKPVNEVVHYRITNSLTTGCLDEMVRVWIEEFEVVTLHSTVKDPVAWKDLSATQARTYSYTITTTCTNQGTMCTELCGTWNGKINISNNSVLEVMWQQGAYGSRYISLQNR